MRIGITALALAAAATFASAPDALQWFRFRVGNYDMAGETASIGATIKLFSSCVAGFYDSGGVKTGLNVIPAENLVKRRIFQDIQNMKNVGLLLVIDRDKSVVKDVRFIDMTHAVAVVDEDWFFAMQEYGTRKPLSGKKANIITVRYFLRKVWGRWIVSEYEVYGRGDGMPPVDSARYGRW